MIFLLVNKHPQNHAFMAEIRKENIIMGYCIEMTESSFTIKKENFEKALQKIIW